MVVDIITLHSRVVRLMCRVMDGDKATATQQFISLNSLQSPTPMKPACIQRFAPQHNTWREMVVKFGMVVGQGATVCVGVGHGLWHDPLGLGEGFTSSINPQVSADSQPQPLSRLCKPTPFRPLPLDFVD